MLIKWLVILEMEQKVLNSNKILWMFYQKMESPITNKLESQDRKWKMSLFL